MPLTQMKMLLIYLLLLAATLQSASTIQTTNNMPITVIGAMFPKSDNTSSNTSSKEPLMRKAFSLALRIMNECSYERNACELLSSCDPEFDCRLFHRVKFTAVMMEVEDDLMSAIRTFNDLLDKSRLGISALIGPHYTLSSNYIQGLCDMHDLPNIFVMPEPHRYSNHSINIYPDMKTLGTIYTHLVKSLQWTDFLILYEKTENLAVLEKLLKLYPPRTHSVYAIHLGPGPDYSEPALTAKQNNIRSIIIDCSFNILSNVLQDVQDVGMMSESYEFIITSFDLHGVDLHPYWFSGANITGMRLVDPDDPIVKKFVGEHLDELGISRIENLRVEEALMFDAVALLAQGYKDLRYEYSITDNRIIPPVSNPPKNSWMYGLSLRNYILHNSVNGLTGPVVLDSDGHRRRFKVDILNLHKNGLVKVGRWDPDEGFEELQLQRELSTEHFKVLITLTDPYGMLVKNDKHTTGNERFEGFVIDIIKELSNEVKFNYTFYVQEDKNNGKCEKNDGTDECKCGGMMDKILTGEMDMAITDLTITEDRQQCVEFSTAFWNLGMSILFKRPVKTPASPLSFLLPFHWHVWLYLVAIYIFTSGLFFVLGRLCPDEWTNPSPCIDEPTELYNQFTINNSLWFTIGALVQQGSEIAPIGMSTRTLAGCWWFFCLILMSTYTANLAAFLTHENLPEEFSGIKDLYNQTKYKFGAKIGGSTFSYFESSSNPQLRQLANQMKAPDWQQYMVNDNKLGVDMAEKGNYAFLMESSTIEYYQLRNCKVHQVGDLIDQKSYAIAFKKGFKYSKQISTAISILQERLVIKDLYDRWWKSGAKCFEGKNEEDEKDPEMSLTQLQGVFLALAIGVAISVVLTTWEFFHGVHQISKKQNGTFKEIMSDEIKLIKQLKSVKPVLRKEKSTESNLSDISCDLTMTTQT